MEEKGFFEERHHKRDEHRHHEDDEHRHHKDDEHRHHKDEGHGHHKGEGYRHHKSEGYGRHESEGYGRSEGEGYGQGKYGKEDVFLSKKSLWLMAGGALGVLAFMGLSKSGKRIRPAAVGALKEGFAFKEWAAGKFDTLKEDLEDVVAEAAYEFHSERGAEADTAKREQELLQKIEKMVEEKLAGLQPGEKEA